MAIVYGFCNRVVAHLDEVDDAVQGFAVMRAARAAGNLSAHRTDGDAAINVERVNAVEWGVFLDDTRGLGAAMSMEYGRKPGTTSTWGPMRPLRILHDAFDLPFTGSN